MRLRWWQTLVSLVASATINHVEVHNVMAEEGKAIAGIKSPPLEHLAGCLNEAITRLGIRKDGTFVVFTCRGDIAQSFLILLRRENKSELRLVKTRLATSGPSKTVLATIGFRGQPALA